MYIYAPPKGKSIFPYSIGQLKKDHPNTSFPRTLSDEALARYDIYPVASEDKPSISNIESVKRASQPVKNGKTWTVGWTVEQKKPEEISKRLLSEVSSKVSELLFSCSSQAEWDGIMAWAWTLRTSIKAAKSAAALSEISITGWPEGGTNGL